VGDELAFLPSVCADFFDWPFVCLFVGAWWDVLLYGVFL